MTDRYPIFTIWMKSKGFTPEHKFSKTRRWRMDYAHKDLLICLEIQGGIWMAKGGHNTGSGITKDIEKYNEATLGGWALLFCTPEQIKKGTAHQLVERALSELDPLRPLPRTPSR